jgi:hypothetical protein
LERILRALALGRIFRTAASRFPFAAQSGCLATTMQSDSQVLVNTKIMRSLILTAGTKAAIPSEGRTHEAESIGAR